MKRPLNPAATQLAHLVQTTAAHVLEGMERLEALERQMEAHRKQRRAQEAQARQDFDDLMEARRKRRQELSQRFSVSDDPQERSLLLEELVKLSTTTQGDGP